MPTIAIQMHPNRLANPDLDLRYHLPELLAARSGGLLTDNGYDYGRTTDVITVFLGTKDLEAVVPIVLEALSKETLQGNRLSESGLVVATCPLDDPDAPEAEFTVIYPLSGGTYSRE